MDCSRAALGALAAALTGSLVLAGCGSSSSKADAGRPATPSASTSATAMATAGDEPEATESASAAATSATKTASGGTDGFRTVVSGTVTQAGDTTASVSGAGGVVAVRWSPETQIVDTVVAKRADVAVGACVLVRPPDAGPSPTRKAITAGTVRVIASSPSCPPVRTADGDGSSDGPRPSGGADGPGSSLTIVDGPGVIGSVSAVTARGFTLRSRDGGEVRVVAVTTSSATRYVKAGDRPRRAIEVGRCLTAWGDERDDGSLRADRIRVSDPVDGSCPSE